MIPKILLNGSREGLILELLQVSIIGALQQYTQIILKYQIVRKLDTLCCNFEKALDIHVFRYTT